MWERSLAKKAQSSMDYLLLTGVVIAVVVPLLFLSSEKLGGAGESQLTETIQNIRSGVVSINNLGYGAATRVVVQIPGGVTSGVAQGNSLYFVINGELVSVLVPASVYGSLPINEGLHRVNLFNNGSHVVFSECGNNIVEPPEQCDGTQSGNCKGPLGCINPGQQGECNCACANNAECYSGSCVPLSGTSIKICSPCSATNPCDAGLVCISGVCKPGPCSLCPGNCCGTDCCFPPNTCVGGVCTPPGGNPEGKVHLNCDDGVDNDLDTEWDWDTQNRGGGIPPKGDDDCKVGVTLAEAPSNACLGATVTVSCTSTVYGVDSIGAEIDNIPCTSYVWNSVTGKVDFTCSMPAAGAGSVTAICTVDTAKSHPEPGQQSATTSITIGGGACGGSVCGNGALEGSEECDYTSSGGIYTLKPACSNPSEVCDLNTCMCDPPSPGFCGDGIIQTTNGEQCDYNSVAFNRGCAAGENCDLLCQCQLGGYCGNAVVDPWEICDPNAAPNGCPGGQPECTLGCNSCFTQGSSTNRCGNGALEPGEECERNLGAGAGTGCNAPALCGGVAAYCTAGCSCQYSGLGGFCPGSKGAPQCGNGAIEPGEACENDGDCPQGPSGTETTCQGCQCVEKSLCIPAVNYCQNDDDCIRFMSGGGLQGMGVCVNNCCQPAPGKLEA